MDRGRIWNAERRDAELYVGTKTVKALASESNIGQEVHDLE